MKELQTDILDILALLLIAFGVAAFVYQWLGLTATVVAGLVIGVGSHVAARVNREGGSK